MKEYTFTRVVKQLSYETYEVKIKADSPEEAQKKAIAGDWFEEKHVGEASETEYLAFGVAEGKGNEAEEKAFLRCTDCLTPLGVDDGDDE